jgi:hypothetical protein
MKALRLSKRNRTCIFDGLCAAIAALVAAPVFAQSPASISGVLAAGEVPELVQEGFTFTEGPVGSAEGGLFFSDIRANKTHYLDQGGKIGVIREETKWGKRSCPHEGRQNCCLRRWRQAYFEARQGWHHNDTYGGRSRHSFVGA